MKIKDAVKAYLEVVEPEMLLDGLGARNVFRGDGVWIRHSCLIDEFVPHHSRGDANPSAALNRETMFYSCFAYGSMPVESLLRMKFRSNDELLSFLRTLPARSSDVSFADSLTKSFDGMKIRDNAVIPEFFLDGFEKNFDYMTSIRGVSKEVCLRHNILFDAEKNSVVIPLYDGPGNDGLIGVQRRNLTPGYQKYLNDSSLNKEKVLFWGRQGPGDSVVLVESIMSVLKMETFGLTNVVSVLGSRLYDFQIARLSSFRRVVVWFDDDKAGVRGALDALRKLSGRVVVEVVVSDIRGKDPGDMTKEEIERNLAESMPLFEAEPFLRRALEIL